MLPYLIRKPSTLADRGRMAGVEHPPSCPRCDSANTKFCYYNNYSLSQPRYFCKGCRRYWTKGGSLRNVPVGGGCRKNRRASKPAGRLTVYNRPGSDDGESPNFGCHRLHAATVRPDLLLDDRMAGSCHSGGGGEMSSGAGDSGAGGADIDLALLYTKFVNPRTDVEFDFLPPGEASLQGVAESFDLSCIADSDRFMDVRLEGKKDASGLQIPALSGIFPVDDAQAGSDYYLSPTRDSTFYLDSGFCLPPPPPSGENIISDDIFFTGSAAVSIGLPWEQGQSPVCLGTVEEGEEDPPRHPYPFVNSCNTFSFTSCRAFPET